MNPDSETSATEDILDPSSRLLQVLNDQRLADIDECVAEQGTKVWINKNVDPKQLVNPVVDFEDVESITCLTFASLVNDFRTVRQLVEAGSDVRATDWTGCTSLHYACASRVEAQAKVEYMLQRDASLVNATNYSENAVLHPESDWSTLNVVPVSEDDDSEDDDFEDDSEFDFEYKPKLPHYSTPLHVAAGHGQTDCVKTLVNVGKAPVNATDEWGRTALHLAADAGRAEAVAVLVQHPGCRVNATTRWEGRTALHLAVDTGNVEAVKVLLSNPSCDVSITDGYGLTAAHTAREQEHSRITKLIKAKAKG